MNAQPTQAVRVTRATPWFFNRGVLAILDQGIVSATSFVTVLVLGRLLSQETLGIYHLTIGLFFFLQCISEQLVHLPYLIRQSRISAIRLPRLNGSVLIHNFVLSGIGTVIVFAIGGVLWTYFAEHRAMAIAFMTLSYAIPWLMLRDFIHNFLHTRLSQFNVLILDLSVVSLQLAMLALIVWLGLLSVPLVFGVMGIACGVISSVWLLRNRSRFEFRRPLLWPQWRYNWIIGRWALGSYLIGSAAPLVLPWLLAFTHGLKAAGLFAACMTLAGLPQMFLRGTAKYLAPLTANAYGKYGVEDLNGVMRKFYLLYLISMSAAAVVFGLFGESLLQICFNGSFVGLGSTMLVLGLVSVIQGPDMVAGSGLNAISRTDLNFAADAMRCIAMVAAAPLVIPYYGVLGVAFALLIGTTASCFARVLLYLRTTSVTLPTAEILQ